MSNKQRQRIRELNDALRKAFKGGRVSMTRGIDALPVTTREQVFAAVRGFDEFNDANDPYGEHDFGSVDIDGVTVFFKIDLYEDPVVKTANGEPAVVRVLTIMLAEEY